MATKRPTVRQRDRTVTKASMNLYPDSLQRLQVLLRNDQDLRLISFSDWIDWSVEVYRERITAGGGTGLRVQEQAS